ncbi:MAG: prolyl oligopeptidase family serine peptidase [Bacteroidota bacterium]|nr:prolyl oligopeptidase family serine peptidase [Bacteroidota bacterium]
MKLVLYVLLFVAPDLVFCQDDRVQKAYTYPSSDKVAADFRAMLKRTPVNFRASFQSYASDTVSIERGFIYTEEAEKMPVVIYKPAHHVSKSFPVVICLHGTGGSKDDESIKDMLYKLSKIGIMGVAIDARFHGERVPGGANKSQQYVEAITKAWENSDKTAQAHPFFYDTVYDLWRLTDYLVTRADVQAGHIGMMGISMGGIETWMAASVDERIKVAVPVIAAQSFKWSLENNKWQGRAGTIWKVHEQAARDLKDSTVTEENVRLVWKKLLPGITDEFDCPSMLRLFAPRPLLLLSNQDDQNCPIEGAKIAFSSAKVAYKLKGATDKLQMHITPNQTHRFLPEHAEMTIAWFKKWL